MDLRKWNNSGFAEFWNRTNFFKRIWILKKFWEKVEKIAKFSWMQLATRVVSKGYNEARSAQQASLQKVCERGKYIVNKFKNKIVSQKSSSYQKLFA